MKKLSMIVVAILAILALAKMNEAPETPTYETYETVGMYADCGLVFTEDGNIWEYWQEGIANHSNVRVTMSDNGTPEDIEDDEVLEIVEDATIVGNWITGFCRTSEEP